MKNKAHIFGTIGILLMLVGCGNQEDIKKAEDRASCKTLHWIPIQGMVSRTPQFNKADWLFVEQVQYKDESDALLRAVSPKGRAWEMSSQEVAEAYRSGYFATTKDDSFDNIFYHGYVEDGQGWSFTDSAFNKRKVALLWARCEFTYDFGNYFYLDGVSGLIYNVAYIFSIPRKLLTYLKCADGIFGYLYGILLLLVGAVCSVVGVVLSTVVNTCCHPFETLANLTVGLVYFDSPYRQHWLRCVLNTNLIASLWDLVWGGMIYPIWQALTFWL